MSTIDNRVVEMNFDNSKFGQGVSGTLSMLDKLKAGLHLGGASQGLKDINTAAQGFNSGPMEQGVGRIAGSFTALQATAFGALANIGSKISNMAMNMANQFTLAPMKAGFDEYELKMGSIQTILANTSKYGTSLQTVNSSLDELNHYADQTIYNFGDMTKNIGLFTNAGIKVEDATTMIKGFSNAAAASGTSAEGASGAAYQLSQALSAGKVTLMDWRSLQNVGMGNKNMQQGIIDIAGAMGTMKKAGVTSTSVQKDFNGSLEKGWLSADVMSSYLKIMSGDMDAAQMKTLGLTDAQIKGFEAQAKMGLDAATKVRTFTQLMSTLKEAVGSGWSETFGILFGDFNEATDLFTSISGAVGGFVGRMSDSRNSLLQGWKDLGGRTQLIEGLSNSFTVLGRILGPIFTAFRNIFPQTSAQQLYNMTEAFNLFMEDLIPSEDTVIKLVRTFEGFFAILHIGWTLLKALGGFLINLFAGVEEGNKGILDFTATVGGFFMELDAAITAGDGLNQFFDRLLTYLFKIINPIKDAGQVLGKLFAGVDAGGLGTAIGNIVTGLLTFGDSADKATKSAGGLKDAIFGFFGWFATLGHDIANFIAPFGDAISEALSHIDFSALMDALQTLSLAGIAVFIKQLGGVFKNLFKGFAPFQNAGGGIMDKIKTGLDKVTGTLSAMQANLKATMLLKIAGAIALLALAVVLLASVDAAGLARATAALTVMFIQLGGAMVAFQKIGTVASIVKLNLMGAALILMSVAILMLAGAVKLLASMSWEELAKGMGALTGLIAGIIVMSKNLDRSKGAILRSAGSLIIMAAAVMALVASVKMLGSMDLASLAKGLGGVAILLVALALFTKMQEADKKAAIEGASLLLLAIAIRVLADAVTIFAQMSWGEMIRGFAGLSAGLYAMGVTMEKMPKNPKMILTALAIGKIAGSMILIAKAFKQFEDISWETLAKGMIGMGGAMYIMVQAMDNMPQLGMPQVVALILAASAMRILADAIFVIGALPMGNIIKGTVTIGALMSMLVVSMNEMEGTDKGVAALLLMAVALRVMLPVLTTLGAMPIPAIVIALTALAGVFLVLGLAAHFLEPAVPVLMGLGIAIALVGAAMMLAGAGVFLFATGLSLLAVAGAGATASIVAMVAGLIGLIPMVIEQIGKGLVAAAVVIGKSGVAITEAMTSIIIALLQAIINATPKIVETILTLIFAILTVIDQAVPSIIQSGIKLLMALLSGIAQNIGGIVTLVVSIIVNFINAVAANLPRIIQAGFNLIIAFMNGIGDAARSNGKALGDAAGNMATGLIDGFVQGIKALGGRFKDALLDLAKAAFKNVLGFFGIHSPSTKMAWVGEMSVQGLANGLNDYSHVAEKAATGLGENTVKALGKTITGLGDMIGGDIDMNPVISPVLDLTSLRKDAGALGSILGSPTIDLSSAYSSSKTASDELTANRNASDDGSDSGDAPPTVSFTQINNSPKALSNAEIYRQTNSQLSRAKGALTGVK